MSPSDQDFGNHARGSHPRPAEIALATDLCRRQRGGCHTWFVESGFLSIFFHFRTEQV